ncbi:MAG TPA: D-aminoacylase, partial [Blastocatellia bacterium]
MNTQLMRRITLCFLVLVLPLPLLGAQTAGIYDLVIMNGRVVDGTGNPWFVGDVGIRGDRIVEVGHLGPSRALRRIDARGMIVAPGFIDMLGQSEYNLLIDPRAQSKVFQGITTEVTGEGGSIAPVNEYILAEDKPFLDHFKLTCDWTTLGGYFDRFARGGAAINLATYVGATQVRECVLHDDNRPPTPEELDRMRKLVADAMQDGAVGLSTSLIYAPAFYARTEELIELAKVASQYGGVYATHMRNEGDSEMAALDEAIRIGREAHIPVEVFHLKVSGKQNWGKMGDVLKKIQDARASGVDITADQYPYVAGATSLGASIPPWVHEGGNDKFVARLKDPDTREKIKKEMTQLSDKWENLYMDVGGGEGILVAGVLNRSLAQYEGKRISEVAKMMGKPDEIDALLDLVAADNGQTSAIYFMASEDDVRLALQQPWVSVGTDHGEVATDGPLAEGNAHPRGYGTFP